MEMGGEGDERDVERGYLPGCRPCCLVVVMEETSGDERRGGSWGWWGAVWEMAGAGGRPELLLAWAWTWLSVNEGQEEELVVTSKSV